MQPENPKPPQKPKFRSFLLSILSHLQSKSFHPLPPSEKTLILQSFINQSSENSLKTLYSNYHYKSLISDICSDLLYNLKEKEGFSNEEEKKAYLLSFFIDFRSIETSRESGKLVLIIEKTSNQSNFIRFLTFLMNELRNNNDLRTYIVQIADLPIPLYLFLENLLKSPNFINNEAAIIRDNEGNIEDLAQEIEIIEGFFEECLIDDEETQLLNQLEKRGLLEKVLINGIIKRKRLKILEFLNKIIEKGLINEKLKENLLIKGFGEKALKALNSDDILGFIEISVFLRKIPYNNETFFDIIYEEIKTFINENIRRNIENLIIENPIFSREKNLYELINKLRFLAFSTKDSTLMKYYDFFSIILLIFIAFLDKKTNLIDFFLEFFLKEVNNLPFQQKHEDFLSIFLDHFNEIGEAHFPQADLLFFSVFSFENPSKPLVQETFYKYLEKSHIRQDFSNKFILKILDFSSDSNQLITEKVLFCLIEKLINGFEAFIDILILAIKRNFNKTLRIFKEKKLFERILQDEKLLRKNKNLLAFLLENEALRKDQSLSFHCELIVMEIELLKGNLKQNIEKFKGLLDFFNEILKFIEKNKTLKSTILGNKRVFEKIIDILLEDWKNPENSQESLDLFAKNLRKSPVFLRLLEKMLRTKEKTKLFEAFKQEKIKPFLDFAFNKNFTRLFSLEIATFYLEILKKTEDLSRKARFLDIFLEFKPKSMIFHAKIAFFFQMIIETYKSELLNKSPEVSLTKILNIYEKILENNGFFLENSDIGVFQVFSGLYQLLPLENREEVLTFIEKIEGKSRFSPFFISFSGKTKKNPFIIIPRKGPLIKEGFSILFWLRIIDNSNEKGCEFLNFLNISNDLSLDFGVFEGQKTGFLRIKLKEKEVLNISDIILNKWTFFSLVFSKDSKLDLFIDKRLLFSESLYEKRGFYFESLVFSWNSSFPQKTELLRLGPISIFNKDLSLLELNNLLLRTNRRGLLDYNQNTYFPDVFPEKVIIPKDLIKPILQINFQSMRILEKTRGFFLSQISQEIQFLEKKSLFFLENIENSIDSDNDLGFLEKNSNVLYGLLLQIPNLANLKLKLKLRRPFLNIESFSGLLMKSRFFPNLLISTDFKELGFFLDLLSRNSKILKNMAKSGLFPLIFEKTKEIGVLEKVGLMFFSQKRLLFPEIFISWLLDFEVFNLIRDIEGKSFFLERLYSELLTEKAFLQENIENLLGKNEGFLQFLLKNTEIGLFEITMKILEVFLIKSNIRLLHFGDYFKISIFRSFQRNSRFSLLNSQILSLLIENFHENQAFLNETIEILDFFYRNYQGKQELSIFESIREYQELEFGDYQLIEKTIEYFWLEILYFEEKNSKTFEIIRKLAPFAGNFKLLNRVFQGFLKKKGLFIRKINAFMGFFLKSCEIALLYQEKKREKGLLSMKMSDFNEEMRLFDKEFAVLQKIDDFEAFSGFFSKELLPFLFETLINSSEKPFFQEKSSNFEQFLGISAYLLRLLMGYYGEKDEKVLEFIDFLTKSLIFYYEGCCGLDKRYLDKLLLIFEDILRGEKGLFLLKQRIWLEMREKSYSDDRFLMKMAMNSIANGSEIGLFWVISELVEKIEKNRLTNSFKKPTFFETFTKKSSFLSNSNINTLIITAQNCLIRYISLTKSSQNEAFLIFLDKKLPLFFLISKGDSEKNLDLLISFLEFFWEYILNEFPQKSLEILKNIITKALGFFSKSFLKKTLEFYDISAWEKGFDFLIDNGSSSDFFIFIKSQEIHCRLHMVLTKKLKLIADIFLRELLKKAQISLENPLVFTEEIDFLDYISGRKSLDSIAKIEFFKEIGLKKQETSFSFKIRPWAYFSEAVDNYEDNEELKSDPTLIMRKSVFSLENKDFEEKIRVLEENSEAFRLNSKAIFSESLILSRKLARNLEKAEKSLKSSKFALGISTKIGPNYMRKLVFPKKVSASISKERRFSWLSSSIINMQNSSLFLNKLLIKPQILAKTMDMTPEIELFMFEKPKNIEFPLEKRLKSREFRLFLNENAISEEICDYFPLALLKEREYFLEGIGLLSKSGFYIIFGYGLNSRKLPEKGLISEGDKSKYLSKSKRKSGFSLRKTLSEGENLNFHNNLKDIQVKRSIFIRKHDIKEIHAKRYWLKPCAIELFTLKSGFFLIVNLFKRAKILKKILNFLNISVSIPLEKTVFLLSLEPSFNNPSNYQLFNTKFLKEASKLWEIGLLSNFNYLMLLNIYSGRTFSDLAQYPVFPWVLTNYTSEKLDFLDPGNYRDFNKPVGALTEERARIAKEKYQNSKDENQLFPPFHYGSHYSSAVLVLYYLVRLMPYAKYAINLQGGKFDLSDRLFSSFPETWTLANTVDFKELIPEIFTLPEFLLNLNYFDFGETQNRERVDDVFLSSWSKNEPRAFIEFMRKSLESPYVSEKLHHWIDLIFGYKQKGKFAVESLNIFYFLTYEDGVQLENIEDPMERNAYLDQINEYGQTPKQLFIEPHIEKKAIASSKSLFISLERLKTLKRELITVKEKGLYLGFEDDWSKRRGFGINSLFINCYEENNTKMPDLMRKIKKNKENIEKIMKVIAEKELLVEGGLDGRLKIMRNSKEIKRFQGVHYAKIEIIEFLASFSLLFTIDKHGLIAVWDLESMKFMRKAPIFHFKDRNVYDFEEKFENFDYLPREKPRKMAFCEENGDFAIVSKHYVSVFTINCVLLAINRRNDFKEISEVQIKRPINAFEDDYVILGDNTGEIWFFILKLRKIEGIYDEKPRKTKNIFTEHYRNNKGALRPYELFCVFRLKAAGDDVKIRSIAFSKDQRKMWSLHKDGEIYEWLDFAIFFIFFEFFFNFFFFFFF